MERIISHHSYKRPYGLAHDIALIKLKRPAQINRAVNPACLPGSSGAVSDGKMCWVTGINRREFRSGLTIEGKSQAKFPLYHNQVLNVITFQLLFLVFSS